MHVKANILVCSGAASTESHPFAVRFGGKHGKRCSSAEKFLEHSVRRDFQIW